MAIELAKPGTGDSPHETPSHFIREAIAEDLKTGRFTKVITRFPPEPNGHLHIGHAKALHIDYGMAQEFKGEFHLRFDDTNPSREDEEYVQAIIGDVMWLGCDFGKHLYYASDYFEKMYEWAVVLIKAGRAYVCDLTSDQVREYRGTLTVPGRESPGRNRTVSENLDLFERMRKGEFAEGSRTLRAKIDMASPNINLRDPVMYRIVKAPHHRQGSRWCIYPMYDWAHGLEDSIEGITHSLCSLEYEDHRPLYDWFLEQLPVHHPRQMEFARLNLTYTVMSKRKLLRLVQEKKVSGWDDPRLPTLSGLRRRGYTPEAIRLFCERIGVAKRDSVVDVALLEFCLREVQNRLAPRYMGVLRPLKVVIDNYPEGQTEQVDAVNNPEDTSSGMRKVPFSRELYIERDDFMENPPKKFYRLAPGREVRLRYAYFITCTGVVKDENGGISEIRCAYDPATRGGDAPDGRSPKATMHWVSAKHAIDAEVRLYDRLFSRENPDGAPDGDFMLNLNQDSLTVLPSCRLEPNLKDVKPGFCCQFERLGYFCADPDSRPDMPVFNRTVTLRDEWAKIQKREQGK
ncbi:MAG: glutamine--tRNA ligase/YqeY domain fusion protein [Chitinispirillaceae bacterium]|nr:glutamine--tRNA ligase/YqeY domain fusion protein [Chitinispirillaceae bacterium]